MPVLAGQASHTWNDQNSFGGDVKRRAQVEVSIWLWMLLVHTYDTPPPFAPETPPGGFLSSRSPLHHRPPSHGSCPRAAAAATAATAAGRQAARQHGSTAWIKNKKTTCMMVPTEGRGGRGEPHRTSRAALLALHLFAAKRRYIHLIYLGIYIRARERERGRGVTRIGVHEAGSFRPFLFLSLVTAPVYTC